MVDTSLIREIKAQRAIVATGYRPTTNGFARYNSPENAYVPLAVIDASRSLYALRESGALRRRLITDLLTTTRASVAVGMNRDNTFTEHAVDTTVVDYTFGDGAILTSGGATRKNANELTHPETVQSGNETVLTARGACTPKRIESTGTDDARVEKTCGTLTAGVKYYGAVQFDPGTSANIYLSLVQTSEGAQTAIQANDYTGAVGGAGTASIVHNHALPNGERLVIFEWTPGYTEAGTIAFGPGSTTATEYVDLVAMNLCDDTVTNDAAGWPGWVGQEGTSDALRAADDVRLDASIESALGSPNTGALYASALLAAPLAATRLLGGSSAIAFAHPQNVSGNKAKGITFYDGSVNLPSATLQPGGTTRYFDEQFVRFGVSFDATGRSAKCEEMELATDANTVASTRLSIGRSETLTGGARACATWTKELHIWTDRLADTELQTLVP